MGVFGIDREAVGGKAGNMGNHVGEESILSDIEGSAQKDIPGTEGDRGIETAGKDLEVISVVTRR